MKPDPRSNNRFPGLFSPLLGMVIVTLSFWVSCPAVSIRSISQNSYTVNQYSKFELTFALDKSYSNPFDPAIIDVSAIFTHPDQTQTAVPAFYYRAYQVTGSNPEHYRNPGPELWKVRFAPSLTGSYGVDIAAKDASGSIRMNRVTLFECIAGSRPGIVRRNPLDDFSLQYADGSPRLNLGHNVCWLNGELAGCQNYFSKMAQVGENWGRVWMCPWSNDGWVILEFQKDHYSGYFSGVGRYSQQTAQRIDGMMELAEQYGVALQLVMQYHGAFSTTTNANWADNPYNAARPQDGGFLPAPEEFFTNAEAIRLTQNKYRYIIARWGYSPSILAWELWNEVQYTDGWNKNRPGVVAWHQTMAGYIRSIDAHRHLITTSSHSSGFEDIWRLDNIDLIQVHHYGTPVIGPFRNVVRELTRQFHKPVVIGEFGADEINGLNSETNVDSLPEPYQAQMKDALVLHNGVWSAFHTGSSAHLWWWDGYIEPLNLYPVFAPLNAYLQGESFAGMHPAPRAVPGFQPIVAVPLAWDFYYVPTQTVFTLENGYFAGMDKLPVFLQGSWHNQYRSDPTFNVTLPQAGQLIIHVQQVSAAGNNSLKVMVNGSRVFSSGYAAGSTVFDITVPLPAGQQSVQIVNTGPDWFKISSYEFTSGAAALLDSVGLIKPNRALLWVYDINSQYGKTPSGLFTNQPLLVDGLDDGLYQVVFYDTRQTAVIVATQRRLSTGGRLTASLPDFQRDIAIKVFPVCLGALDNLVQLAGQWLASGQELTADYTLDQQVNLTDFQQLATHWLTPCPQ